MNINFNWKKKSEVVKNIDRESDPNDKFLNAIDLFKIQRKKNGFSLEELSNRTKISRNVLIAIENGWKKYLPEKTYLISMLKKIESELGLEKQSLNGLLDNNINLRNKTKRKFNFLNIAFLNTWKGSLIYILTITLCILGLNIQQRYLLQIHSQSIEPVYLIKDSETGQRSNHQEIN